MSPEQSRQQSDSIALRDVVLDLSKKIDGLASSVHKLELNVTSGGYARRLDEHTGHLVQLDGRLTNLELNQIKDGEPRIRAVEKAVDIDVAVSKYRKALIVTSIGLGALTVNIVSVAVAVWALTPN